MSRWKLLLRTSRQTFAPPTVKGECNLIPEELASRNTSQQQVAREGLDTEKRDLKELSESISSSYLVEEELYKIYCDDLRAIRAKAGVSQEEFAEVLGLSLGSLRLIEEGKDFSGRINEVLIKAMDLYGFDD